MGFGDGLWSGDSFLGRLSLGGQLRRPAGAIEELLGGGRITLAPFLPDMHQAFVSVVRSANGLSPFDGRLRIMIEDLLSVGVATTFCFGASALTIEPFACGACD